MHVSVMYSLFRDVSMLNFVRGYFFYFTVDSGSDLLISCSKVWVTNLLCRILNFFISQISTLCFLNTQSKNVLI